MVWQIFVFLQIFTLGSASQLDDLKIPMPTVPRSSAKEKKMDWESLVSNAQIATRDHTANWGIWTKPVFCPEEMYIWGYQGVHPGNPSTIERIDFLCHGISQTDFHHSEAVMISTPFNISFGVLAKQIFQPGTNPSKLCEYHHGPLVGYNIIQQNDLKVGGVDQGIVGFGGTCASGIKLETFTVQYTQGTGTKTSNATCAGHQAGCGFRLRYQYESTYKSIVDVDLFCCDVIRDYDRCDFTRKYKVVAALDNREKPTPTEETIEVVRSISVSSHVASTQSQTWDRTHSSGITNSYLESRVQFLMANETNNKYDLPISVFGLIAGIGEIISGATDFLTKGVGALLNAAGLGDLFNVGYLAKLVGEPGYDNLANLGESGLEYYFQDTDFGTVFESDVSSVFRRLTDLTKHSKLQTLLSFQGYDSTLRGLRPLFGDLRIFEDNSTEVKNLLNPSLSPFQSLTLYDIFGIYGIVKAFGPYRVLELMRDGALNPFFNMEGVSRKFRGKVIELVMDSDNVGRILKVFGLAFLYHPNIGMGTLFCFEKDLEGSCVNLSTEEVQQELFNSSQVDLKEWCHAFTIFALSKILEANDCTTEDSVTEDPVTEDSVTEDSVTEEDVTDNPVTDDYDPPTDNPVTEDPATDDCTTDESVTEDSDDPVTMLEKMYNASGLSNLLGEDGLNRILESEPLLRWFEAVDRLVEKDKEFFIRLFSLIGVAPKLPNIASKMSAPRFRKLIGGTALRQILGLKPSAQIVPQNIASMVSLYAIHYIFGDTDHMELVVDGVDYTEWSLGIENYTMLGETIGIYTIGRMYGLSQLQLLTGPTPPNLHETELSNTKITTEMDQNKIRTKRQIPFLSELFTAGTSLFTGGLNAIGMLIGKGAGSHLPTSETVDSESLRLNETFKKSQSSKIKESISDRKSITQEITKAETNITTQWINNTYQEMHLTLIVIPELDCEGFYSVDLVDKKNYITITIPNARYCTPVPYFVVVREFNYLDETEGETRIYRVRVGTEWMKIQNFRKNQGLSEIILAVDPSRGVKDRLNQYKDILTGDENLSLRQAITQDIRIDQVWRPPKTFEEEAEVVQYNYVILIQTVVRCGEMETYSSVVENFRFPKVIGCTPTAVFELVLPVLKNGTLTWEVKVGLQRGGKSINRLQPSQRSLPEVQTQLQRILNELLVKAVAGGMNELDQIVWKNDITIIQDQAWKFPTAVSTVLPIGPYADMEPVVHQLLVRCGPFQIGLTKSKIIYKQNGNTQTIIIPRPILMQEPDDAEDEAECQAHFPC